MPEREESYVPEDRGFGGKLGSRKTLWLTIVIIVAAVAVGAFYLAPQFL